MRGDIGVVVNLLNKKKSPIVNLLPNNNLINTSLTSSTQQLWKQANNETPSD